MASVARGRGTDARVYRRISGYLYLFYSCTVVEHNAIDCVYFSLVFNRSCGARVRSFSRPRAVISGIRIAVYSGIEYVASDKRHRCKTRRVQYDVRIGISLYTLRYTIYYITKYSYLFFFWRRVFKFRELFFCHARASPKHDVCTCDNDSR